MKEQFKDILSLSDVKGALVVSPSGQIVFQRFTTEPAEILPEPVFQKLVTALTSVDEMELLFEDIRLYIRKYSKGFIIIVTGRFAHMSMVRLNCDILIPVLSDDASKPKGLARFFKR